MLFLFFFFVLLFGIFLWGCWKCANPYRLVFVFGKKGSGKSCYMVSQMIKFKRKGWNVYTDMEDVKIPGVLRLTVQDLSEFQPLPNSLICLDEVGISMDNRFYKSFPPGLRDFFKYARKMRCRLIFNSQSYDVDKKVRDTVDSMLLAQAVGPVSILRPIRRSITLTEPSADAESRIADKLSFTWVFSWRFYWLPAYFPYFDTLSMPARPELPSRPVEGDPACARPPLLLSFIRVCCSFRGLFSRVPPIRFR